MMDSPSERSQNKKVGKSKFTAEEDAFLTQLVQNSIEIDWSSISKQLKNRNARQCRERWQNYLNPNLNMASWTPEEDIMLIEKFKEHGPHWNVIAKYFGGRSGNSVRNRILTIQRHGGQMTFLHFNKPLFNRERGKNSSLNNNTNSPRTISQPQTEPIDEIFSKKDILDLFTSFEGHQLFN